MRRNALIPVPMYVFWRQVMYEVNKVLKADYRHQDYVAEIYRGIKRNAEIEEVVDECVARVNADFTSRGVRSKYPITPMKGRVR